MIPKRYDYKKSTGSTIAIMIIALNIYLMKYTFQFIKTEGGPMGFGLWLLPFLFSYHIFLISAIKELILKEKNFSIYVINCLGLIWIIIGVAIILGLIFTSNY